MAYRRLTSNRKIQINRLKNGYTEVRSKYLLEINFLGFQEYIFDQNDIQEAENWNGLRYPRLVEAQKENLAEQGKPTDYLELYKMVEEGEEIATN